MFNLNIFDFCNIIYEIIYKFDLIYMEIIVYIYFVIFESVF